MKDQQKQSPKSAPKQYRKPTLVKKEQSRVCTTVCGLGGSCGEQVRCYY